MYENEGAASSKHTEMHILEPLNLFFIVQTGSLNFSYTCMLAYSGTLIGHEIVRANVSLGELRRDKEKLSLPISCEFVRVKAS